MPLASRASTARAERTGAAQKPADVRDDVQPRRGKEIAAAPAHEPQASLGNTGASNDSGDEQGASENASQSAPQATAPTKERKPRAARPAPAPDAPETKNTGTDMKALKARMGEIEKAFKLLIPEEQKAMRAVAAEFKEKRVALESEHRLLSQQLSSAIFNG